MTIPIEQRGSKRPTKIMTGLRRRPRKHYQIANNDNSGKEIEFSGFAEILIHDAINDCDKWFDSMAK